ARDSPAQDNELWVQDVDDHGKSQAQPACEIFHHCDSQLVTGACRLHDIFAASIFCQRGFISSTQLCFVIWQRGARSITLQAATFAAGTRSAIRHDSEVTEFWGGAKCATVDFPTAHKCCPNAGADSEKYPVFSLAASAKARLTP